jgi:hypothetical protein
MTLVHGSNGIMEGSTAQEKQEIQCTRSNTDTREDILLLSDLHEI